MATDERPKNVETPASQDAIESLESQAEQRETPEQGQETKEAPEVGAEQLGEQQDTDQLKDQLIPAEPAQQVIPATAAQPVEPDRLEKEIESILQEDLTDMYLSMPPDKQRAFKEKGEETTGKVRQMVSATKVNTKKIFGLIKDWLKMIPGVNKFFLEQEAKIKTDKILLVSEEEKKRGGTDLL